MTSQIVLYDCQYSQCYIQHSSSSNSKYITKQYLDIDLRCIRIDGSRGVFSIVASFPRLRKRFWLCGVDFDKVRSNVESNSNLPMIRFDTNSIFGEFDRINSTPPKIRFDSIRSEPYFFAGENFKFSQVEIPATPSPTRLIPFRKLQGKDLLRGK